jgi:tRNA(Ile)-lysidine synthase
MRELPPVEARVITTIRKYDMLRPGEHVLIAASGGADSMALLHALVRLAPRLCLQLTGAHLNHGIRGTEADADQRFVQEACAAQNIPFITETVRLDGRGNLEALARRARYDFLRRVAAERRADKIAVGHTINDQAETVLLRLFRGSGTGGLGAIHPVVDGVIIRPLLECTRSQVVRYLQSLGVPHCEDSTNRNLTYRRNRARLELIPYLEAHFNPRVVETLARHAEIARESQGYLEDSAGQCYLALRRRLPDGVAVPVAGLFAAHVAARKLLVRQAIFESLGSRTGVTTVHVDDILEMCRRNAGGRRIVLPGGVTALLQSGQLLILRRTDDRPEQFCRELRIPGECPIPEIGIRLVASLRDPPFDASRDGSNSNSALLDSAGIPPILTVRSRLPGDRYGGPPHGKVKKLLINAKVPKTDRARLAMVATGEAVIWIPGFRPAKSFAVRSDSSRCIELRALSIAD